VSEQDPKDVQRQGEEDKHLQRLLAPAGVPWFVTIIPAIKELIRPPKLPPLEVTSKPVEVKSQWGLYRGNETKAGLSSVAIHVAAVALLLYLGSLKPVQDFVQKDLATLIAPNLRPYIPKESKGGGGGGARAPLEASKGKLPKPAPRQFTPPRVDPLDNPKLPMPPTIVAPELPTLTAQNMGDPLSRMNVSSNGLGIGGGIGSGSGGGVGPGRGPGVGPGSGGGFGGGAYRIGGGVSQPTLIAKVEPEYSEEARKAKWQGVVALQIIVDESGNPTNIKVIRSLGLGLDQKAIEAVMKWRFRPGMKDGKPVPVFANVEVNFRLL
jgi:TonB family protein